MDKEKFEGTMWECASGRGDMSKVLEKNGFQVYSSDIRKTEVYGDGGIDFLHCDRQADNIITNPPFIQAQEFIEHAKKNAKSKVAMFLKLTFLEGVSRYKFFHDKEFPFKKIYVFSRRVKITKNGEKMKNSTVITFAWFVWEKTYVGEPTIDWICPDKESEKNLLFT